MKFGYKKRKKKGYFSISCKELSKYSTNQTKFIVYLLTLCLSIDKSYPVWKILSTKINQRKYILIPQLFSPVTYRISYREERGEGEDGR